jgi:HAD superfamily hydrolase (TIGR01509 family)
VISGVFFDLGGTLFSYRNVARATIPVLLEASERLGISADPEHLKETFTQAGAEINVRYADKPYFLHVDYFADIFRRFTELVHAPAKPEIHDWYLDTHRVAMIDCLVVKEDCLATLEHLRSTGLYVSVVSNIDDDMLTPLIEREGLGAHLHHWTSSEAAGSCKPHRGFFEHALELAELKADEVLFVGDSPEQDIVGAHAVGMQTALIVDGGMAPPMQTGRKTVSPDHTIHSLSELRAIVAA